MSRMLLGLRAKIKEEEEEEEKETPLWLPL
jgi:hypothetical protein